MTPVRDALNARIAPSDSSAAASAEAGSGRTAMNVSAMRLTTCPARASIAGRITRSAARESASAYPIPSASVRRTMPSKSTTRTAARVA